MMRGPGCSIPLRLYAGLFYAFLYLPKHKILCTGDACTNGPFNFLGHSDTASWIRVMEKAQQLDVNIVCPGHGQRALRIVNSALSSFDSTP